MLPVALPQIFLNWEDGSIFGGNVDKVGALLEFKDAVVLKKVGDFLSRLYSFDLVEGLVWIDAQQPIFGLNLHVHENLDFNFLGLYLDAYSLTWNGFTGQFGAGFFEGLVFLLLEYFVLQLIAAHFPNLAVHAVLERTGWAVFVGKDIVAVEVALAAQTALEGQDILLEEMPFGRGAGGDCHGLREVGFFFFGDEFVEGFGAYVEVVPDVAEFWDGSEDGPLEFVDEVAEGVGALDELGFGLVDHFQLDLANYFVVEPDVQQDVVCALPKPVLYSDYFHPFGVTVANRL